MGILLKRALDRASVWHRDQKRKYPNVDVPYMSHLAGVAAILSRHGFDEEVVAAGALHDSLEDTGATVEELQSLFGERVARLVVDVSEEDKSLPWEVRKQRYLEHFKVKHWDAQAITLADKIDNFQSIIVCARDHGDPWAMFKRGREAQLGRFHALAQLLDAILPHPLVDEYRKTLAEVAAI